VKQRLTSSRVILAVAFVVAAAVAASAAQAATPTRSGAPQLIKGLVVPKFQDVTQQAGVTTSVPDASCGDFVTGAAWGDVNRDGWLDLFVARIGLPTQLFVNDGHGHFTDQAAQYGVQVTGATAAVFADFTGDGKDDLYVVRTGPDILFRNDGNGHFTDVTAASGISDNYKGSSVSVADYDNDGHLDIYVTNYAECGYPAQAFFNYHPDALYHNNGNGTFTNVTSLLGSTPAGVGLTMGAGFQAAWFDANGDGRQDLYLGNDYLGAKPDHNRFWLNMGPSPDGWQFLEDSVQSGTAFSMNTMGIAVGDYDRDLKLDLALSNIRYNRLLHNNGDGTFSDLGVDSKVDRRYDQSSTQVPVTWATAFYDFNLDGWEDLYFAAGNFRQALDDANEPQPNELFVNDHNGTFTDMSTASGSADKGSSKGVAFADYDRDGRMDMFVVNQGGTPDLLRNVTPMGKRHWLEVNPVGRTNTDGCGARMVLKTKTGSMLREVFCGSTSVASGSQRAPLFGLGQQTKGLTLTVTWPSGTKQVFKNLKKVDRFMRVVEPAV
jgi:hypothetical protein